MVISFVIEYFEIGKTIMKTNSFDSLKIFIKDMNIAPQIELSRETTLEQDLGIYGDDIEEFFYRFSKEFNVDLSEFKSERYFKPDWLTRFRSFVNGNKIEKRQLTLGDLEAAIIKGVLE